MPNIPSIKIGDTTYDVKDQVARDHLVEVGTAEPTPQSMHPDNRLYIQDYGTQQAEEAHTYEVPTIDEFNDLKSALGETEISLIAGGWIHTGGTTTDYTVNSSDSYYYAVVDCTDFDMFTVYGVGGSAALLWAFVANDGTILNKSDADAYSWQNPEHIIAPVNAVKLVINSSTNLKSYRGFNYVNFIDFAKNINSSKANQSDVDSITGDVSGLVEMTTPIKKYAGVSGVVVTSGIILRPTGLVENTDNTGFKTSDFIEVTEGDKYYLSAQNVWGNVMACFYTSNGVCFTQYNIAAQNVSTPTVLNRYEITIPSGVAKIKIAGYQATPNLEKKIWNIDYNAIKTGESALNGKKITVIGDSITEHNYWAKTNWAMWISQMTGCDIQNLGVSGSGFWYTSPYINRINQIDSDTDIIGVAVSFNDLGQGKDIGTSHDTGTETICGYANDFFTALNTAFPTTPIICYSQGTWADIRPGIDYQGGNTLISEMKKICANHGIPYYFDMYEKGSELKAWIPANKTKYYKCDDETSEHYGTENGTHPNSLGHKFIANYLLSKFEENVLPQKL